MKTVGKGLPRPTKAQASDLSRFSTGAEGIEPMGSIVEITVRRRDGTERTFSGPNAEAEAAAFHALKEWRSDA